MSRKIIYILLLFISVSIGPSCKNSNAVSEETKHDVQSPVEVTHIKYRSMNDELELNATAVFLLKHYVKATTSGYLTMNDVKLGAEVNKGQVLFSVKTKEAVSLGNSVNMLDSGFKFSGVNGIKAGDNGFITQLDHQTGDYVQDGEQLATISSRNSFVFLMNMPYEYRSSVALGQHVKVVLPDSETLDGIVASMMPLVEVVSQTQSVVIKVNASHAIPENLIAKVYVPLALKPNAVTLPKASILTSETQSEFWIMKMAGNGMAIKMPVKKGIETKDYVEILSPVLNESDLILVNGNYGLDDSASVKIVKEIK